MTYLYINIVSISVLKILSKTLGYIKIFCFKKLNNYKFS